MTIGPETLATHVDPARMQRDWEALAAFTNPDLPYTRRAFSPVYKEAREWLAERMRDAGLRVRVDAASNLIGRHPGERDNGPVLMAGSHIDTVEAGGRFDGVVGVLGALEVARALQDAGVVLQHPLEIVDFTCEEPTLTGMTPFGSRVMSGELTAADLVGVRTPLDEPLAAAIDALGGNGAHIEEARRAAGDMAAYLELHIEQGPVLERANVPIGVVTAIAARCSCFVTLDGQADHAGATLMPDRRDALAGAAEVVLALEQIASDSELIEETVGTVGWMRLFPNMVNIIPGHVEFRAEVRSTDAGMLEAARSRLQAVIEESATRRGLQSTLRWEDVEQLVAIPDTLQRTLEQACRTLGLPFMHLPSRATHDAARLASIAPVGMLFIPCKDGKSHVPEEWAELDHIVQGVRALAHAVVVLDQSL